MRPYQLFATMDPDTSQHFFSGLAEDAPGMFKQLVQAAAQAMKSRPAYVNKLSMDKKANAMRRALARVGADTLAGEMLAVYFLECRKELLTEWLDGYFDTTTGPKREPASYAAIAAAMGLEPGRICFVSDVVAELDAARTAGMETRLCVRPGNAPVDDDRHAALRNFDEL